MNRNRIIAYKFHPIVFFRIMTCRHHDATSRLVMCRSEVDFFGTAQTNVQDINSTANQTIN